MICSILVSKQSSRFLARLFFIVGFLVQLSGFSQAGVDYEEAFDKLDETARNAPLNAFHRWKGKASTEQDREDVLETIQHERERYRESPEGVLFALSRAFKDGKFNPACRNRKGLDLSCIDFDRWMSVTPDLPLSRSLATTRKSILRGEAPKAADSEVGASNDQSVQRVTPKLQPESSLNSKGSAPEDASSPVGIRQSADEFAHVGFDNVFIFLLAGVSLIGIFLIAKPKKAEERISVSPSITSGPGLDKNPISVSNNEGCKRDSGIGMADATIEALSRLDQLHGRGILTDSEYEAEKGRILVGKSDA